MEQNFKTKVNSKWQFNISDKDLLATDIVKLKESKYHILQENKSFQASVEEADFSNREYSVKINGTVYRVSIQNKLDQLIKNMGFVTKPSKNVKLIKAPMPGLVLDVLVKVGQTVSENDPLLVLEAMKMESTIASPSGGLVKFIAINSNETVEKGQLLIEFE